MQILKVVILVFIVVLSFILLIFPIFLNIKIIYNYEYKKFYYLIQIFGFIKIVSGYGQYYINKIVIHISDTKAFLFEIIDLDRLKKSFKPLMDYHFIKLNTLIELGSNDDTLPPLKTVFMLNYLSSIIKWFLVNKKPYIVIDNNFSVYESEKKFNFYGKTLIVLNILMILISIIKIVMERIIYEFRKNKQSN